MREIKFRAWDTVSNEMFYDFVVSSSGVVMVDTDGGCVETDSQVLMQHTGLKDKKGKEIYEGDIVSHEGTVSVPNSRFGQKYNETIEVKFEAERGGFIPLIYPFTSSEDIEVIGNIYQNKELLKEE